MEGRGSAQSTTVASGRIQLIATTLGDDVPTYDLRLQRAPLLIFLVVVVVVVVVATTPNYLRQASQNLGKYYTTLCQATNQPPWQTPNRSWLPTVWPSSRASRSWV